MRPSCKWPINIKIDKTERVHVIKVQNRKRKGEKKNSRINEKKKKSEAKEAKNYTQVSRELRCAYTKKNDLSQDSSELIVKSGQTFGLLPVTSVERFSFFFFCLFSKKKKCISHNIIVQQHFDESILSRGT